MSREKSSSLVFRVGKSAELSVESLPEGSALPLKRMSYISLSDSRPIGVSTLNSLKLCPEALSPSFCPEAVVSMPSP